MLKIYCVGLFAQEPQDILVPVGATGIFTCIGNFTDNTTMLSWSVTARGFILGYNDMSKATLNSYGIRLLEDTPQNMSVLLVDGVKENNKTSVRCTVFANGLLQAQSDSALLSIYGM